MRSEFLLSRDHIHLALMLLTSHPRPVREAIERHRRALDENPSDYFEEQFFKIEGEVRAAAAQYMGGAPDDIALTDSTTMALAVLYGGLPLRPGQEVLTTTHDHYSTHENLRLAVAARRRRRRACARSRCTISPRPPRRRRSSAGWWRRSSPHTRVVAVTWVHSSTGVKLPIRRLAAAVGRAEPQARRRRRRSCLRGRRARLRRRARNARRARVRLLRRRLPQVDVRPARHRRVVGAARRLEGSPRADRPVRAAALHRLDEGPHPRRARPARWPPRAASTPSSTAGRWARPSPSTGASAASGSPRASTRWPRSTRRGWQPCPTSRCTRRCRPRCPPGWSASR